MILLDTNILIYASSTASPYYAWSTEIIAGSVKDSGAAVNHIVLAELFVGEKDPAEALNRLISWGVQLLDVPLQSTFVCAAAYKKYLQQRQRQASKISKRPLPDFFIGAHAAVMGWEIVTADQSISSTYFPTVKLKTPE